MARTYRHLRSNMSIGMFRWFRDSGKLKNGVLRDGVIQFASSSCRHHGECPYCTDNRLFSTQRRLQGFQYDQPHQLPVSEQDPPD